MSNGNEFQRSDATTGNVRRPTVVSWIEIEIEQGLTSHQTHYR